MTTQKDEKERKKKKKKWGVAQVDDDGVRIQRLSQEKANKTKLIYRNLFSPPFCDYYL